MRLFWTVFNLERKVYFEKYHTFEKEGEIKFKLAMKYTYVHEVNNNINLKKLLSKIIIIVNIVLFSALLKIIHLYRVIEIKLNANIRKERNTVRKTFSVNVYTVYCIYNKNKFIGVI